MASKTTTINSVLTPSGNIEFANEALGAIPSPPQDRFTSGSLVSNILSVSEAPMLVLVGASLVLAADQSVSGNASNEATGEATGALVAAAGFEDAYPIAFVDDSQIGKSGIIDFLGMGLEISDEVSISGVPVTDPVILALAQPRRPYYSLLSLINKVEDVCKGTGKGFVVSLDQGGSSLDVFIFSSPANAASALTAARTAFTGDGGTIKAAFDMIVPTSAPGVVKYAFE